MWIEKARIILPEVKINAGQAKNDRCPLQCTLAGEKFGISFLSLSSYLSP